jgi:hypothetical protein
MKMTYIRTLAFAGLAAIASIGTAAAAQNAAVRPNQFYSLYQGQNQIRPVDGVARYDHSGSIGRLDLGASPFHPEGPGNFSD